MKHVSKIRILLVAMAIVATAIVAGCASAPLRTETSMAGIKAAEEVGAAKVPRAALHLQLAKEQLEQAKDLAKKGEHEMASSMVLRAEADVELALMLSHEDAEKRDAEEAMARVRQLRQDNP